MSCKPFMLVITIFLSIAFLTACASPAEGVITSPLTDPQLLVAKASPRSPDTTAGATKEVLGLANPAINLESTSLNTNDDLNFDQLPLYFVENVSQTHPSVAYYVLGGSTQVYFSRDGVTIALAKPAESAGQTVSVDTLGSPAVPLKRGVLEADSHISSSSPTDPLGSQPQKWVVKLDFVGANPVQPAGTRKTDATVSYFTGGSDQWHAGLSTYTEVIYRDLWPGIDLVYYGQAGKLSYDFIVHPGADPSQIQIRYRGTDGVSLNPAGQMLVSTPLGGFVDEAPVAYQVDNGERILVSATYKLGVGLIPGHEQYFSAPWEKRGKDIGVTYGFTVEPYDRTQPLVIDPAVLIYCGYIGGLSDEVGRSIALDGDGNVYITGETLSNQTSFPVTIGPDLIYNGLIDVFVTKVNPSGTALMYAGYIGGAANEYGWDIAVDGTGNAYIVGQTTSDQNSFPVTVGPDLTLNGDSDAFLAKLNSTGTTLLYAGYIGGVGMDVGFGVAVDGSGNAYVTGKTDGSLFPVKDGPDLTFNGVNDAFIAKVSASGKDLIYAGYIGGSSWDWGYDMAVDNAGNAYVVGDTRSDATSFPVAIGPDLTYNGSLWDAFVAKVSASGMNLDYAGYIGGSNDDMSWSIALDNSGHAYVTGDTASNQDTFPVTIGPDLTFNGGEKDAFVAKVSASGEKLDYAGYIGGVGGDFGTGIAVDAANNAYIVGTTYSNQVSFPVTPGPLSTYNGGDRDAFVTKLNEVGTELVYSGYIGGLGTDYGIGIAVDSAGNAYVTGATNSNQVSFPVAVGPDLTYNGGLWDAFVAKVSLVPWTLFLPLSIK